MNRFDFYKGLYETENNRRTELNDSLNIPLAIIVIVGTVVYTFLSNFKFTEFNFNTWIFIISCSLSTFALIISIIYFSNVFGMSYRTDYKYRYLAYTDELEGNYRELDALYKDSIEHLIDVANDNNRTNEHFENFLIDNYVICCGANTRINDRKSSYLNLGKEYLVLAIVFLVFAFFTFIINYFYHIKQ
ncbi:MAG: hypothetical protein K1X86_07725 [Ignavibacteria bacterium]|nr:hypothetical protein [Ignavibacteria bacterium]